MLLADLAHQDEELVDLVKTIRSVPLTKKRKVAPSPGATSTSAPVSTTAATSKKKLPKKTTTKASKEPTQPPQGTSSRPAKRMRTRSSAVETTPAQSPALAPQAFAPPSPATVDLVET